jgi:hypothetical protein
MDPSDRLAQIEAASVRSWPALETADIDGWLWRYASGGSFRANSVSALAFSGKDMDAAIREIERRYRAKGARSQFTITEVSHPVGLDARLEATGYKRSEDHATMVKAVSGSRLAAAADVEARAEPTPEWMAVYLSGLTPNRRESRPPSSLAFPPAAATSSAATAAPWWARACRSATAIWLRCSAWPRYRAHAAGGARTQHCALSRRGPPVRAAPASICRWRPSMPAPWRSMRALAFALPADTICA